jgi:hypothetical protein
MSEEVGEMAAYFLFQQLQGGLKEFQSVQPSS